MQARGYVLDGATFPTNHCSRESCASCYSETRLGLDVDHGRRISAASTNASNYALYGGAKAGTSGLQCKHMLRIAR